MAVEQMNRRTDEQGMIKYCCIYFVIPCSIFICSIFNSCSSGNKKAQEISIQWDKTKASSILIPRSLLPNAPTDSLLKQFHVYLLNSDHSIPVLGTAGSSNDYISFTPLIAFTRGLTYELRYKDQLIDTIHIPAPDIAEAPAVMNIFPEQDTVPQNLLKLYIVFSKPMQEGHAFDHIYLLKNGNDTVKAAFLGLEPELWNNERTVLTVWFDPGRIKRDLQPNKTIGPPLLANTDYELIIADDWRSSNGTTLIKSFSKKFTTKVSDYTSPDINNWHIQKPAANTNGAMLISFGEVLDHELLLNTISIVDPSGKIVQGDISTNQDQLIQFIPVTSWKAGDYTLRAEARLEDLAGNNLNHLFDNDLTQKQNSTPKEFYTKSFSIK